MPAKWFRKNMEAEEDGCAQAERWERNMEVEAEDALTRGGGRGGGR